MKNPFDSKDVANLRGEIGLIYDLKRAGSSSESGVCGQVWRGHIRVSEVATLLAISTNDGLGIQDLRVLQAGTGANCATNTQQLRLASHFIAEFV